MFLLLKIKWSIITYTTGQRAFSVQRSVIPPESPPFSPSMNHILVVSHLKGGVGKTSTAINLCGGLALYKKKVLLIDLDPQGNASSALGFSYKNHKKEHGDQTLIGISEVLLGRVPIHAAIYPYSPLPNFYVCPSNPLLVGLPQSRYYFPH